MSDPDYAGNDNGLRTVVVCAAVLSIATVFAGARIFCRIRMVDWLYADDWIIMASLVCGWVAFGFNVMSVKSGLGKHMSVLTTDEQSGVLLYTIAGFFPGILSFTLPKLAVISLLCRMLNPSRMNRIFMWSMGALLMANAVTCFGMLMGRCVPFQAVYDVTFPPSEAKCFSAWYEVDIAVFTTICCAIADLYLAVYPSIVLFGLQMSKKKKIALSVALGIGSISVIVSAYKATRLKAMAAADFSYENADLNIWTLVEGSVVMISASIPLLKPLVDLCFGVGAMDSSGRKSSNRFGFRSHGHSGSAMELKDTPANTGSFNTQSLNGRKSRNNSMTMTRMIARAAGDTESQETILDDSPSASNITVNHADTGKSLDKRRSHNEEVRSGHSDRHKQSRDKPVNGISRTTDITIQYSTDDGLSGGDIAKQQKKEWV